MATAIVSSLIGSATPVASGARSGGLSVARRGLAIAGSRTSRHEDQQARRTEPGTLPPVPADASRSMAVEWLTTLADRPFRPSAQQLAWVTGGDPGTGKGDPRRTRIAAARFAGLFADHVAQDIAGEGGPGAYALVWQCARWAFIETMSVHLDGHGRASEGPHA